MRHPFYKSCEWLQHSGWQRDGLDLRHVSAKNLSKRPLPLEPGLYSAENLQKLAETSLKWITRVPATLTEAQEVLGQANPQTMAPLTEGYRYHVVPSSYGGVAQRWVLIYSEPRQPQAQRTVDKQWRKQSDHEVKAFQTLCR